LIETAFRMSTVSTNTHDHHSHLTSPITSPWSSANDNLVFDLIESKTEKKISQRYQTDINHGGVNWKLPRLGIIHAHFVAAVLFKDIYRWSACQVKSQVRVIFCRQCTHIAFCRVGTLLGLRVYYCRWNFRKRTNNVAQLKICDETGIKN
jgi:hypothetical protein